MNTTFLSVKKIIKWVVGILLLFLLAFIILSNHSVLTPFAVSTNSPSLCKWVTSGYTMNDYVLGCYASVASANHNPSVCNYIATAVDSNGKAMYETDGRSKCYGLVAVAEHDPTICNNESNFAKDNCYVDYSRMLEDLPVCKHIENIKKQIFCYAYFRTKSGDACYEIKDEAERLRCIKQDVCGTHQC